MDITDVAIIGGGPAGYSAAIYAARFRLSLRLFAETPGGLIITTHLVENWPGIPMISGWDLMQRFQEHLDSMQIPVEVEKVEKISRDEQGIFHLTTDGGTEVLARTVILGTGSEHRKLGVPGEKELANKGVSYCATCDAALFKDKTVAIVGGGDSAAKEALLLSEYCPKVYVLYRGAQIRPEPINAERVAQNPRIEVVTKVNVTTINGTDRVESVTLDDGRTLEMQGVFIAIGHLPQNELAKQLGVELESSGEIKIDRQACTNVPGVYAAGDVANNPFKQAITGASEGVAAAFSAYEYVRKADIQPV